MNLKTSKCLLSFYCMALGLGLSNCRAPKHSAGQDKEGFVQIFDGKTLNQWKGDPTYWKVEDSCLVGIVTPETLLKRNTFIIWQGKMPEKFRAPGGIQGFRPGQ